MTTVITICVILLVLYSIFASYGVGYYAGTNNAKDERISSLTKFIENLTDMPNSPEENKENQIEDI